MRFRPVLLLGLLAAACEDPRPPVLYQTVPVERRDIVVSAEAAGSVEPHVTVEVKSQAAGEILEIQVETGALVERDTLLVRIDQRYPRNALAEAKASLDVARARLANVESQKRRAEELFKTESISEMEYDQAVLDHATAKAEVIRAGIAVENARIEMDDTDIRAPITGTIIEKNVESGQVISSPTRDVGEGTLLLKMADLSRVRVRTLVDETDIGKLSPGLPATVTVAAYPSRPFDGVVAKIEPQAVTEQNVTMFPVLVGIENPEGLLKPGMNCEVEVHVERRENVLVIPNAALRTARDVASAGRVLGLSEQEVERRLAASEATPDSANPGSASGGDAPGEAYIVFVLRDGSPRPVHVRTGLSDLDYSEVLEGLSESESVLVLPSAGLVQSQEQRMDRIKRITGGGLPGAPLLEALGVPAQETLEVAFRSIRANPLRAILTMLGIIIGVAAVITMLALGTGAQRAIDQQISALGARLLVVYPGQHHWHGVASNEGADLTTDDAHALARDAPLLSDVVPEVQQSLQVEYGRRNANLTVLGTTPNFAAVRNYSVRFGHMFTRGDAEARRRYAVLGASVPGMLGSSGAALVGQTLLVRGIPFEVVGIFDEKGSEGSWFNPDEQLLIPLPTAQYRVFGTKRLRSISVQVAEGVPLEQGMVDLERVLRREHRIRPGGENDFRIRDRRALLDTQQQASQVFTYLLASIAGVSLLVGGIGIMNIMLVSVTERTREIGIRKALGATRRNILTQFLVEALVLCLVGGLLGIGLGAAGAVTLARVAGWNTFVSAGAVGLAFCFSAAVGILFGLWPARRAARLNPVDALRYE